MKPGTPLVNGLYPIIRRVRRPLVIADDDAAPAPTQPPVTAPPIEGEPEAGSTESTSKGENASDTAKE